MDRALAAQALHPKGSEGDAGNKYICAYIVPGAGEIDDQDLVLSELREYLLKKLPDYMIPAYFSILADLPLTSNGKVDRQGLESVEVQLGTGTAYVPPGTEMEELVAETWKEVLKVDKPGIHDSFFELGGNSMGVILVNNKLKEALNKDLPVALLYRYFTISSFARYLTQEVLGQEQEVEAELDMDREEEIRQGKQRIRQSMRRRRI